jgi:hypothetical protein
MVVEDVHETEAVVVVSLSGPTAPDWARFKASFKDDDTLSVAALPSGNPEGRVQLTYRLQEKDAVSVTMEVGNRIIRGRLRKNRGNARPATDEGRAARAPA